jgi:hypothetical protein
MIIEFRVKNHRCFRDEQVLSLVAGPDKSLPDNVFEEGGFRLLRSAAIYGPNASGKSSLIEAIGFMRDLVVNSAKKQPGNHISVNAHQLDPVTSREPSLFELSFVLDGAQYQYGFTATGQRVLEEWLYEYQTNRAREWFRRDWDPQRKRPSYVFPSQNLKGRKLEIAEEAGENRLFLSWGANRNHEQLLPIYEWFRDSLCMTPRGEDEDILPRTDEVVFSADANRGALLQMLRSADLGISDVKITEKEPDRQRMDELMATMRKPGGMTDEAILELLSLTKAITGGTGRFNVRVIHRGHGGMKAVFNLKDESEGTRRFFALAGPWIESLTHGSTVFVDEIHESLHPMLTRQLVELFHDSQWNRRNAQLVMTTHDVSLMDSSLFRRDQIWLTEKDEEGAAHLYSLSDYKKKRPRKEENWQKSYMAGKYGAVPILGDFEKP